MKTKNIFFLALFLLTNYNTIYTMEKEPKKQYKKKHICPRCNHSVVNFKQHLLTHTEIKPHQCGICTHGYNDINNCRRHVILCCQRNFINSTDFNNYIVTNKVKLIHQCSVCNDQCRNSKDYHRHMNKYHPEHVPHIPQYIFKITASNKPTQIANPQQHPIPNSNSLINSNSLLELEPWFGNNETFDLLTSSTLNNEYNLKLLQ